MRAHLRKSFAVVLSALCVAGGQEYQAAFSTSVETAREFLGTSNAKLAYVNYRGDTKALHFIDFSEGSGDPTIHRIPNALNPTSPIISPDGRWVVFASAAGVAGEAGTPASTPSDIYICKLEENAQPVQIASGSAYEPRFVQNPGDGMLTVVYPTSAENRAFEGTGQTMIAKIDTTGGTPSVSSTTPLFTHAGYTGGLSYDNANLCGGGGYVAMTAVDASSAAEYDTVMHPYTLQACNASITSSRVDTDLMMYLDFGPTSASGLPSDLNGGQSWTTWEIIFIGNPQREVVKYFSVPENNETFPYNFDDSSFVTPSMTTGYDTYAKAVWHHPEWSNHPYFAVATVNIDRKYHYATYDDPNWSDGSWQHTNWQERVVLVNLKDSVYQEVLRRGECCLLDYDGKGFFWPSLWVEVPQDFVEAPNWVPVTSWVSPGRALRGMRLEQGTIVADQPLTMVTVHDLRGRRIGSISPQAGRRQVSISRLLHTSGTVLVSATAGETTQTWRVSVQQ